MISFQDVERLKPHIVRSLANAELYCMALSHLYADPNFHNLNHWGIIQALARKGICVAEPPDCALTETMLIQTNPLKMVRIIFSRFKPMVKVIEDSRLNFSRSSVLHLTCSLRAFALSSVKCNVKLGSEVLFNRRGPE